MISSAVKNSWNWTFANFRDLVLILPEAVTEGVLFKIFKNTFFTEYLWMAASILQQLLALYFAMIYSW